jgi:hypothetical protein
MSFTRFFDDPCRIQKYLEESTTIGNYNMNVPGNGASPTYFNDPYVKMQKWGGNLSSNKTDLESELFILHRKLNRDSIAENNYVDYLNHNNIYNTNNIYNINNNNGEITGQSRATHPAWIYREINNFNKQSNNYYVPNNFKYLHLNPQTNVCIPFHSNISSRMLQKDYYALNNNFDREKRITNE